MRVCASIGYIQIVVRVCSEMLMPVAHRRAVYEQLFGDGVLVCEKNHIQHLKDHPYMKTPDGHGVPILHVIKTMRVLLHSYPSLPSLALP